MLADPVSSWQLLATPGSSCQCRSSSWQLVVSQKQLLVGLGNSEAALGRSSWLFNIWLSECFSPQQFLAAPGNSLQLLAALGSSWQFRSSSWQLLGAQTQLLAALGSSWQLLVAQKKLHAALVSSWQLWTAPGSSCHLIAAVGYSEAIHGSSWRLLVALEPAWLLLPAPRSSWQLWAAAGMFW